MQDNKLRLYVYVLLIVRKV